MRKKQTEYVNDYMLLIIPFGILWIQIAQLLVIFWNG